MEKHGKKDFPEKIKEAGQYNQLTQTPPLSKYVPISKTIKTAPLNNTCSVQRKCSMMGLSTAAKSNTLHCRALNNEQAEWRSRVMTVVFKASLQGA